MKRFYILIIILGFVIVYSSCMETDKNTMTISDESIEKQIASMKENKFEIIVIDNCEYIVYKRYQKSNKGFGFMSHKGNCNNPYHIEK